MPETGLSIDLSELDGAVEGGGVLAREGIGLVVAGEGGLVEDGSVAADEAPVGGLDHLTGVVLDGQADVEDLAVVLDIGVVAVGLALALEARLKGGLEEGLSVGGEAVGQGSGGRLRGRAGQWGQDGQGSDGGDGDGEGEGLVAHHGD